MRIAAWKVGLFAAVSLMGASATSSIAHADAAWGPFTANIALTTDYRFRGISQTDRSAAVQGEVDYTNNGWYAGVWASNVDFLDSATKDAPAEVDLYAGYNYAWTDTTEVGLQARYYWYPSSDFPGSPQYDYFELQGHIKHTFEKFTLAAEVDWSPDYFFESGTGVNLFGTATVPLFKELWLFDGGVAASGHAGYQWIEDNAEFGTPDYFYWDLGITATAGIFSFDARYVDTNLSKNECFGGAPYGDWCQGGFVGTVSVALPG